MIIVSELLMPESSGEMDIGRKDKSGLNATIMVSLRSEHMV